MPLSLYIQNDKIKLSIIQNQARLHKRPSSLFLLKVCLILENSLSYRRYQFSVQVNSFLQILPIRRKSTWKQNLLKQQFVATALKWIFCCGRIEPIFKGNTSETKHLGRDFEARFGQDFEFQVYWRS